MSDLLFKAKRLIQETGCSLSDAATALKNASEDYDLALALLQEKSGSKGTPKVNVAPSATPSPAPTPKPAQPTVQSNVVTEQPKVNSVPTNPTPLVNRPQPTNVATSVNQTNYRATTNRPVYSNSSSRVRFKIPKSSFVFMIGFGAYLAIAGLIVTILYFNFTQMEYADSSDYLSMIIAGPSFIFLGIISIFLGSNQWKQANYFYDDLDEIKAAYPNLKDAIIWRLFVMFKKDKAKVISVLSQKGNIANAYVNSSNNSLKNNSGAIASFVLALITAAAWMIAAFTYDPTEDTNFGPVQFIGVVVAFIFLIAYFATLFKAFRESKNNPGKASSVLASVIFIALGAGLPAIKGDVYEAFIGTLLGYILGIIVVGIILGALFGRGNKSGKRNSFPKHNDTKRYASAQDPEPETMPGYFGTSHYDASGEYVGKTTKDGDMYNKAGEYTGKITEDGSFYNRAGEYTGKNK